MQSGSGIPKRWKNYWKQTGLGLKTVLKKSLNAIKKLANSDVGKMMIRDGIKKAPDVYRLGTRKFVDSKIVNMGTDLAAGYT